MAGRFGAPFGSPIQGVWAAGGLSMVGDQLPGGVVVLSTTTHIRGPDRADVALTLGAVLRRRRLLSGLADRLPRRRVMLTADLLRAAMIVRSRSRHAVPRCCCVLVPGCAAERPVRAGEQGLLADVLPQNDLPLPAWRFATSPTSRQVLGFAGGACCWRHRSVLDVVRWMPCRSGVRAPAARRRPGPARRLTRPTARSPRFCPGAQRSRPAGRCC